MNNISDFEAHKRDEEFDREDAKRRAPCAVCGKVEPHRGPEGCARVPLPTHAQKVAFADALMADPTREIECPNCGDARIVKVIDDCGGFDGTALCGVCEKKT